MGRHLELLGKKFGRLTVVEYLGTKDRRSLWRCDCDCGGTKTTKSVDLLHSRTMSCGCLSIENRLLKSLKHGECRRGKNSKEYMIWRGVHARCLNKNCKAYPNYGGRGIKLCERWMHLYENFLADMGRKPSNMHTLERIDNNGNYEPSNCRWSTRKDQMNNTRINRYITFEGETKTLTQWSEHFNLNYDTLRARLVIYKWSIDRAFNTPIKH